MGSTLEQISEYLDSEGLQYRIDQDRSVIFTGFGTEQYLDKDCLLYTSPSPRDLG